MKELNNSNINNILHSTDGMQKADVPPFLFGKIMEGIKRGTSGQIYYTNLTLFRLAFAVLIITTINVFIFKILKKPIATTVSEQQQIQQIANEYFGQKTTEYIY